MLQDVPRGRERQYDRMVRGSPLSGYRARKTPASVIACDETNPDGKPCKHTTKTASGHSADLPSENVSPPIFEDMVTDQMVSVEMLRERRRKRQALDDAFAERRMAKGVSVSMQAAFQDIQKLCLYM